MKKRKKFIENFGITENKRGLDKYVHYTPKKLFSTTKVSLRNK